MIFESQPALMHIWLVTGIIGGIGLALLIVLLLGSLRRQGVHEAMSIVIIALVFVGIVSAMGGAASWITIADSSSYQHFASHHSYVVTFTEGNDADVIGSESPIRWDVQNEQFCMDDAVSMFNTTGAGGVVLPPDIDRNVVQAHLCVDPAKYKYVKRPLGTTTDSALLARWEQ